ncbi:MAG: hypothetical protein INF64_13145 [Roseomonas sp.]|nr:hypothetical protein [Roseomonas sp.]
MSIIQETLAGAEFQEALAAAEKEAEMWMVSLTGRRRIVPGHEVPNMVRSIIIAYQSEIALKKVKP